MIKNAAKPGVSEFKEAPTVRTKRLPKPIKVTHLTERSTSRMTNKVKELNEKVLQYINQ